MTEKDEKLAIEDLSEAAGGHSEYDNEEWLIQNNKKIATPKYCCPQC